MIQTYLFSEVQNGDYQSWFDDLIDSVSTITSSLPTPLVVLVGVILAVIVVRMILNLL